MDELFDRPFKPKYLMTDSAGAIRNGFSKVFPEAVLLMCWYHMHAAIVKKQKMISVGNREAVIRDIRYIQYCDSEELFYIVVELFAMKWRKEESAFIEYFMMEWVRKRPDWFAGAALVWPASNSCESFNADVKKTYTLRVKLSFMFFFFVL